MSYKHLIYLLVLISSSNVYSIYFEVKENARISIVKPTGRCDFRDSFKDKNRENLVTFVTPYLSYGNSSAQTAIFSLPSNIEQYHLLCECLIGHKSEESLVPQELIYNDIDQLNFSTNRFIHIDYERNVETMIQFIFQHANRSEYSTYRFVYYDVPQESFLVTEYDRDEKVLSQISCQTATAPN